MIFLWIVVNLNKCDCLLQELFLGRVFRVVKKTILWARFRDCAVCNYIYLTGLILSVYFACNSASFDG